MLIRVQGKTLSSHSAVEFRQRTGYVGDGGKAVIEHQFGTQFDFLSAQRDAAGVRHREGQR